MKFNEPETDFKEVGRHFIVTFKRKKITEPEGLVERLPERLPEKLPESQKRIFIMIKENPSISKNELAAQIGISYKAIGKNIASLNKKNLIRRNGPDKGGHWEIVEK
jgi:ATP-dependent DNA helicase RecG